MPKDPRYTLVMARYLGEKCKYCLREFKTIKDLETTVYAGYHKHGRLAHKACWDKNHQ